MIKLHRLNGMIVAINPDLIYAVDCTPDTTLRLLGGETILVREGLDELIALVTEYRRSVRSVMDHGIPPVDAMTDRQRADADEPSRGSGRGGL